MPDCNCNYKPLIAGALAIAAAGFFAGLGAAGGFSSPSPAPDLFRPGPYSAPDAQPPRPRRTYARGEASVQQEAPAPIVAPVSQEQPAPETPAQPEDPIALYKREHNLRGPWSLRKRTFEDAMRVYTTLQPEERAPYDAALRITGYSASGLNLTEQQEIWLFDSLAGINKDPALNAEQRDERSFVAFRSLELTADQQKALELYKDRLFPVHEAERVLRKNSEKHENGAQPR